MCISTELAYGIYYLPEKSRQKLEMCSSAPPSSIRFCILSQPGLTESGQIWSFIPGDSSAQLSSTYLHVHISLLLILYIYIYTVVYMQRPSQHTRVYFIYSIVYPSRDFHQIEFQERVALGHLALYTSIPCTHTVAQKRGQYYYYVASYWPILCLLALCLKTWKIALRVQGIQSQSRGRAQQHYIVVVEKRAATGVASGSIPALYLLLLLLLFLELCLDKGASQQESQTTC